MKVLHIAEYADRRGGAETYLLGLREAQAAAGWSTALAYGRGDSTDAGTHHVPGISSVLRRDRAACAAGLRAAAMDVRPDVVHVHGIQNTEALAAAQAHAPVVISLHDYRLICPASDFFFRRTGQICTRTCGPACWAQTLQRRCMSPRITPGIACYRRSRWFTRRIQSFEHLVAPSHAARDRVLQAGADPDRTTAIPYFCPVTPRAQPRPTPLSPTLLYLGRTAPNKGLPVFLEALGRMPIEVRGRVIGARTDAARTELFEWARRFGCADRLQVDGWLNPSEVDAALRETSLLIFPSLWPETFGLSGLEAMAHGVPVVASDVGGVPEWCHDGQTGALVPPGDPTRLEQATMQILEDRERLETMGAAALELVHQQFDIPRHLARLEKVYRAAIEQRASRS